MAWWRFSLPLVFSIMASVAGAGEMQEGLETCRDPVATAELVQRVLERWNDWTLEELRSFWPGSLEPFDSPPVDYQLPSMYARFFGSRGRCGDIFTFTRAARGRPQYLDAIEIRYPARSFEGAAAAGETLLLASGVDVSGSDREWRLDESGRFRTEHRSEEPKVHTLLSIQERSDSYSVNLHYDGETILDRPPPTRPEEPYKVAVEVAGADAFVPGLSLCVGESVDAEELSWASLLASLVQGELEARSEWIELASEAEADLVLALGAHWEDWNGDEPAHRCLHASGRLPGRNLGHTITETRETSWTHLSTIEEGARELVDSIQESLEGLYWRLRMQRP